MDSGRWRVENRGELQTIRFDHATSKAVDYARSDGVLGERLYQGSLYVALDAAHPAPVIALKASARPDVLSDATRPYLIQARWRVWGLKLGTDRFEFAAQGFGDGEMAWKMPKPGRYRVVLWQGDRQVETVEAMVTPVERVLRAKLGAQAIENVRIEVIFVPGA